MGFAVLILIVSHFIAYQIGCRRGETKQESFEKRFRLR